MFRILRKRVLAESVSLFEVEAPRVARRHRAGQVVMVRPRPTSERIPLTIADVDREAGTVTLVVQAVGKTTIEMTEAFEEGDAFSNVAGPLGNPTHVAIPGRDADCRGTVACVAGGIGAALRRASPGVTHVGVVADEMPVMAVSHDTGRAVDVPAGTTIADGMAVRVAIPLAVERLQTTVDLMVRVTERAIAAALAACHGAGVPIEPSAAAAFTASIPLIASI